MINNCIFYIKKYNFHIYFKIQAMGCVASNQTMDSFPQRILKSNIQGGQEGQETIPPSTLVPINQKKRHNLTNPQINDMYDRSKGNLEEFFKLLSQRVTQFYNDLSSEILQLLNDHKVGYDETKVIISEGVLMMVLDVLEALGHRINFNYRIQTFHHFNKAQSTLIAYLKLKYPRAGNVFVSSDMTERFKSFDFVDNPKNDILAKCKISFTNKKQEKIIKQVKTFFNSIMQELDQKFPSFKVMMEEKIFKYEEGEGAQRRPKKLNYKIGRKISENAPKFVINDSSQLTINSPQIFRTIIKWVGELQEWFTNTQDMINRMDNFKAYQIGKIKNIYSVISKDQVDQIPLILRQKFKKKKQAYQNKLKELRKDMDIFNINLLKILYTTERKQKYVPLREAKVIKYSMLNTRIVSWMLSEMLIFLIKMLVEVGQQMEATKVRQRLDLIKFSVTDLMRAQVIGNKKQILAVFQNVENLQKSKKINIIKIKNRLGTSLNDAMIIFTVENSRLICELQLILSEGGSEIEKMKNIEFLNHLLYQLERSPYGVLSQIAVILGFKDSKINYESKIRFEKNLSSDFETCKKNHEIISFNVQKKPFICNQCTQCYLPFENILDYHFCPKCNIFQCSKCSFDKNQNLQKEEINKRFVTALQSSLFTAKLKSKIPKEINTEKILQNFCQQKLFFKTIFKGKLYSQLKPKDLINFMKKKSYVQQNTKQLDKLEMVYFLLVQFRGAETSLNLYCWNENQQQIQNCYNSTENFADLKKVSTSYYDFILVLKNNQIQKADVVAGSKYLRLCLKSQETIQNIKSYKFLKLSKKADVNVALIIKIQVSTNDNAGGDFQGLQINEKVMALKKDFVYQSIQSIRKTLPDIESVKQHFAMKNFGLTSAHLDYFKNCIDRLLIKSINVCDNKIVSIDSILNYCQNVEELIVAKNFIKEIKIRKNLVQLRKLIAYENFIQVVEGLEMLPVIGKIFLENNKLKKMKPITLKKLKELDISDNSFNDLKWLQQSIFPELEILLMVNTGITFNGSESKLQFSLRLEQLKQINFSKNTAEKLRISSKSLVSLNCSNCSLKMVEFQRDKIEVLNLASNQILNLSGILNKKMPQVKLINCNNGGPLEMIPQLDCPQLGQLDLSNCNIENASNLSKSALNVLKVLKLDGNLNLKSLPSLKLANLKKLSIKDVNFNNLTFFENSMLPQIQQLQITGQTISDINSSKLECPSLNFPKLKKLKLQSFSFSSMTKFGSSQLPILEDFTFEEVNSINSPILKLKNLKTMTFKLCSFYNVQGFHESQFQNLQVLNIDHFNSQSEEVDQNNQITYKPQRMLQKLESKKLKKVQIILSPCVNLQSFFLQKEFLQQFNAAKNRLSSLPMIKLERVKNLDFADCSISDISKLEYCSLNSLEMLNFSQNKIKSVPQLNMPKLKYLSFENNKIDNLKEFEKSSLPNLQRLNFDNNLLTFFPGVKFQKLVEMSFGKNPIKSFDGLSQCQLGSLQKLVIANCKQLEDTKFPQINFLNCKQLKISECSFNDLDNLEKSHLPQLTSILIFKVPIEVLPVINLPSLTSFQIQMQTGPANKQKVGTLSNIENLSKWKCPKLQNIFILNAKATKLPRINLQQLIGLDLQGSSIQDISQFKKSKLPALNLINLAHNKALSTMHFENNNFEEIEFTGCNLKQTLNFSCLKNSSCKVIELGSNKIQGIVDLNTTQLQILNIKSNLIKSISDIFRDSPNYLKNLNLKSNKIKDLPELIFPKLNYLNLSQNLFTTLNIKKKNFPNLIGLYAGENKITQVFELDIPTLSAVNFNFNSLRQVDFFVMPREEGQQMKLSSLKVQNNNLSSIKYLPLASKIYFKNNALTDLDWLKNCQAASIVVLDVSNNKIQNTKGLCSTAQNKVRFKILAQLVLSGNNLTEFDLKDSRLPSLETLDLNKNEMTKFPQINQTIFPSLINFSLNGNKLESLPMQLNLSKLSILDLSGNKIKKLKTKDVTLKNLKQLLLQDNMIEDLSDIDEIHCGKLEKLNLSHNVFKRLPKLTKFSNLKELFVENNEISSFEGFYQSKINDMHNLRFVYLIDKNLQIEGKKNIVKNIYQKMKNSECCNQQISVQVQSIGSKLSTGRTSTQKTAKDKKEAD